MSDIRCKPRIAIYDSGVGGLVVLHALKKYLTIPYLYFADTLHFPYGDKSGDILKTICMYNIDMLISHVDTVIIACHTMSAVYKHLDRVNNAQIVNVVDLLIDTIKRKTHIQKVGILATRATVHSGVYQNELARTAPHLTCYMQACPGLADRIEYQHEEQSIKQQLSFLVQPLIDTGIDTLALACTHYELIAHLLPDILGNDISIITLQDSLKEYARSWQYHSDILNTDIYITASAHQELFQEKALMFMKYVQGVLPDSSSLVHQESR